VNERTMNAKLIGSMIAEKHGCINVLYEPSMMMNQ